MPDKFWLKFKKKKKFQMNLKTTNNKIKQIIGILALTESHKIALSPN